MKLPEPVLDMRNKTLTQPDLFNNNDFDSYDFPQTRYQGSKYKLRSWIGKKLSEIDFDSVIDAFSGTCSIAYTMKQLGKQVYCNDIFKFNYVIAKSLIENDGLLISEEDIANVFECKKEFCYQNFIQANFNDIYYLDDENRTLDIIIQNIYQLKDELKQSIMLWPLFQTCISKRPYNLFHRKNLYVRTSDVKRNFGNKATWDKPIKEHYVKFVKEFNKSVFNNGRKNIVFCGDIIQQNIHADLVYIDPPYIPKTGTLTQYGEFYHFLEGLCNYTNWKNMIDYNSKHRKLRQSYSPWEDRSKIFDEFDKLFEKFTDSILAISYRSDGIPEITDIVAILKRHGKNTRIETIDYKYVLSTKSDSQEVLIIGE